MVGKVLKKGYSENYKETGGIEAMDEKFEKLTRSWKKRATPHLPAGMEVDGIARGRKNSFYTIRFWVLTTGYIALFWLLHNHLRDWGLPPSIPVSFPASFVLIITTFLLYYLGNLLGIYPFVMIVWNQNQVVLLERGFLGRSINRKIIPRPVPGGLTRKDENTVVIGHEKIVLDYPKIVMDVLERSLGDRNPDQAGTRSEAVKPVPTEEKTAPFARGIEVQSDPSPPKSNKLLGVFAILLMVIGGVGCILFGVGTGGMIAAGIPEASMEIYRVISFLLLGAGGATRIFLKVKGDREAEEHKAAQYRGKTFPMEMRCPGCRKKIALDEGRVSGKTASCPDCEKTFSLAKLSAAKEAAALSNPPSGAWYRDEGATVEIGATTRSSAAFVLMFFTLVFLMPIFGLASRVLGGTFDPGKFRPMTGLFVLVFLGVNLLLIAWTARAAAGRVVARVDRDRLTVFTGVGRFGSSKEIRLKGISNIEEGTAQSSTKRNIDVKSNGIVVSGEKSFEFGERLSEERMKFVLNGLRRVVFRKRFAES